MSETILLVAEASREVGFGHLAEMRMVAAALRQRDVPMTALGLGPAAVGDELRWVTDYGSLLRSIRAARPSVIGWNVRTHGWREIWPDINSLGARHLWIADIPNDDYPAVDALVVAMLEPRWRASQSRTQIYAGPQYFPLDVRGPREIPPVRSRPRQVLLTLGGTDPLEASIRLAPALTGMRATVVIGPGFRHRDELLRVSAAAGVDAVVAPDGLRHLLLDHQVVVSSGGDTLFEAAAAGTPALVAWGQPHEQSQARAFESKGTARVLGAALDVDVEVVARTIGVLLASRDLDVMSEAGPRTVDLGGVDRIADLLIELASVRSVVQEV